ncbi:MAG: cellulase family glycosylhydrolase [Clostridium sp.]
MRKQKRIWAYLLSAAMVVTSFTMSSATGKAEGTTEKGKIVSVTDRTSTKKAASVTEIGKIASVTKKVSTKKTAGTDSFQDLNRQQITEAMGVGYNLGNSLEANSGGTPNETAWGNPVLTKEFVLAAKAAGFQSIRIPVSYLSKIDDNNGYKIDSAWLDHVQEVVDYCVQNDMYAIVNMHGDGYTTVSGSWLLCANSDQTKIKAKYKACWEQIADRFKNYDEHLIFESMNEEFDGTYGTPNKTAYNNINDYNQIFVDTVRQTGGNNDRRWLLIPGWNTNINYTADNYGFVLPTDQYLSSDIASGEKRIMISVHYYDPWDFCGTESADKTQWGSEATNQSKVPTWGDESYMASQFKKMHDKFVSQGYGVIIGEFGAINKANYDSQNKACRAAYYQKVCYYAKQYELVPVAWDNGFDGDYGFCLINRYSCQVTHQDIIDAMMEIYRASSSATGIALDQQEITIHVGDAGTQLNATLTPSDSKDIIKWTSDDEKVATVNSNGLVTAVGAGTCTITASIAAGCQATCKVTVPKPSYIRTKLYMLDTSGWTTIASEQSVDISTKDEEFTLSVKPTDTQLKNIGSLYIKDIQAAEAADSALSYAVITLKSITVNGKQYTIKDDTYTYDGSLKSAASDGLSNNVFDFAFINIWADVMTHIQDVSAERQKKASFNNASYQGNNTVELTFAVSGAKANGASEPSAKPSTNPSVTPSVSPSTAPSSKPSVTPSVSPSTAPSSKPSTTPSVSPSTAPSAKPSVTPSVSPSTASSAKPSATPSVSPSTEPSSKPSATPSVSPSTEPSSKPSVAPSVSPSTEPSVKPSAKPSVSPSTEPSAKPSVSPSTKPSVNPSAGPSATPSHQLGKPSVTAKGFVVYAKVKGAGKIAVGSRYKLAAKKKMKLTVQWVPRNAASQKLTFKSSRPSIVKVTANGTVKAGKKAGKAVITITTANGLSKKVRIQVMKKPVKKLTVKAGKRNLKKGKKLKLKVKAKPGKKLASTQYCWKSSNKKIAAVSAKGVVKAKKKGTVKITVYATDGSGKKKSVKIKVK